MNRYLFERYARNCVFVAVCLVIVIWVMLDYKGHLSVFTSDLMLCLTLVSGGIAMVLMARAPLALSYPAIDLIVRKPIEDPERGRNLVRWAREQRKLEHLELIFQALGALARRSGDQMVLDFLRAWGTNPPQELTIWQAQYCGYAFSRVAGSADDYESLDSPQATVPTTSADFRTHFLLKALCCGHPNSRCLLIRWLRSSDLSRCEVALRSLSALDTADLPEYLAELPGVLMRWPAQRVAISDYLARWIYLGKELPLPDPLAEMFLQNLPNMELTVGFSQRGELQINPQVALLINSKVRDEVWREMLFDGTPTMAAIGAVVLVIRKVCSVTELVTAYFRHPQSERFLLALRIYPDTQSMLEEAEKCLQGLAEATGFEGFADDRLAVLANFLSSFYADELYATKALFRMLAYAPVFQVTSAQKLALQNWRSQKAATAKVLCDCLEKLHLRFQKSLKLLGTCLGATLADSTTSKVGLQAVQLLVSDNLLSRKPTELSSLITYLNGSLSECVFDNGVEMSRTDVQILDGFLSQMKSVVEAHS